MEAELRIIRANGRGCNGSTLLALRTPLLTCAAFLIYGGLTTGLLRLVISAIATEGA